MLEPQPHLTHPKYRPDIDGLRAIAVLSVVAFHAFPNWVKGGFIGVDIFFVISGFLISTIIFQNLDKGTFSFSEFYARRIKRIFPSLFLVLVASYTFGWFVLLSDEYAQLGKHIAAGAGFISNFALWSESGYFDNSADTKPLLHLWSLGIEEQFYIIWPLLLWVAWKRKFNLLSLVILVAFVSFILNVKGIKHDSIATFYSPQTRFWELLCGNILAWFNLYKKGAYDGVKLSIDLWLTKVIYRYKIENDGKTLSNVLSFLGLALLVYSVLKIDKNFNFPGTWALIPVLGSVLIIIAGMKAWINQKILSNKIAVWFGIISFPLYLWHWPLLSFARIVESEVPVRNIRIGAVLLSVILAWLTYKLIERPIRFGKQSATRIGILCFLMAAVGVVGYATYVKNGFGFRFRLATTEPNVDVSMILNKAAENCNASFPDWTKFGNNPCRLQKKEGNSIAIIGDSHAGQWYLGMSELVHSSGGGIATFAASCAAPYIDISSATNDPKVHNIRVGAYKLINSAYEFIINDPTIKTVILAHNPDCSYNDVKDIANPNITDMNQVLENGMRRTFSALLKANKKVFVLFDNPTLPYDPKMCVDRPFRITNKNNKCMFSRSEFDSLKAFSNYKSLVNSVLKDYPDIKTYDLSKAFCDDKYCYLLKNGVLLYKDKNHMSYMGSMLISPYIMNSISGTKN